MTRSTCNIFVANTTQAFDKNEIVPCGVMPIKNLIVLWCLYVNQVSDLASKFEGISMNTSYKADGLPAT